MRNIHITTINIPILNIHIPTSFKCTIPIPPPKARGKTTIFLLGGVFGKFACQISCPAELQIKSIDIHCIQLFN